MFAELRGENVPHTNSVHLCMLKAILIDERQPTTKGRQHDVVYFHRINTSREQQQSQERKKSVPNSTTTLIQMALWMVPGFPYRVKKPFLSAELRVKSRFFRFYFLVRKAKCQKYVVITRHGIAFLLVLFGFRLCEWQPFRFHESRPRCQVFSQKSLHVRTNCCLRLFISLW